MDAQLLFYGSVLAIGTAALGAIVASAWLNTAARNKRDAHISRLLSYPEEKVVFWVASVLNEDEVGPYTMFTLYAQVDGEEPIRLSQDRSFIDDFRSSMQSRDRYIRVL